jgi:AhpD family alkylhydroperoxidase
VLTIARENGCDYCVAMHTPMAGKVGADAALVTALRAGTAIADARLAALEGFTRAVLAHRGQVPPPTLAAFLAAGFSRQQALEVVMGVGAYTLSTYANRLTEAPLDAALEPFRWPQPSTVTPFQKAT